MAEVAPRESIMSLVTEKSGERRIMKGTNIAVEPLMEDSISCFNCGGQGETEDAQSKKNTVWFVDPFNNAENQTEIVASMERQNDNKNE